MKNEISTLQRRISKLEKGAGTEKKSVVFRAIDADGEETGPLTIDGKEFSGDLDEAIILDCPDKAIRPLLKGARHTVLHGGRAGGKSHTIARFLVALAYSRPLKILCVREVQLSIKDSVHSLLKGIIESVPGFLEFFEVLEYELRGANGSLFTFRGMRRETAYSVKSYEGYDVAWVEEANSLYRRSVDLLIPTIRKPGSRLIWSFNPENESDTVYQEFLVNPRDDALTAEILYTDNAFCSGESKADAELDRKRDYEKFQHVWLGGLRTISEGQIIRNFSVIENLPISELPLFKSAKYSRSYGDLVTSEFERTFGKGSIFCGLDWGHSEKHKTVFIIGWLSKKERKVLILDELVEVEELSLTRIANAIKTKFPFMRDRRIPIWCDNSRPESINHFKVHGLNAKSAPKWNGSVKDGITILQDCVINVCERCEQTISDFKMYSYELDGNDASLFEPKKEHDDAVDAIRYGIWKFIKYGNTGYAKLNDPWV